MSLRDPSQLSERSCNSFFRGLVWILVIPVQNCEPSTHPSPATRGFLCRYPGSH
ncbi:hypothetical protein M404DRAFT_997384 [Pisolithus tinctorius Marx 270]|uniref:Uncharacterized protein n=1 Tax=Pisolithus tinctorius Marx 270 TaxID=870435 RepID=A0A0C3P5M5_PISTI|nr:hypothetical protein M404DRAFT_997384 [Pisolithus tinctorius Marx 270]